MPWTLFFLRYLICFWLVKQCFYVYFFFVPIVFRNILTIALLIRNTTLIWSLAIPTGVPMIIVNGQEMSTCQNKLYESKSVIYILSVLLILFLSLISTISSNVLFLLFYRIWMVGSYLNGEKSLWCHSSFYSTLKYDEKSLYHVFRNCVVRIDS